MAITWNDLTVNFEHLDRSLLLDEWRWLIGSAQPILISSVGDAFLQNEEGEILWLLSGSGELKKAANSYEEFQARLRDQALVRDWFLVPVVAQLKSQGVNLEPGKLYGYKVSPALGGSYDADNFELTEIEVHFSMTGQIHEQAQDVAEGTSVNVDFA